jgi:hypothetical protein
MPILTGGSVGPEGIAGISRFHVFAIRLQRERGRKTGPTTTLILEQQTLRGVIGNVLSFSIPQNA